MMRRNSIDIDAAILRIAKDGARKTQIVYRANLNFAIIRRYLKRLTEQGYIDPPVDKGKGKFYHTTPRGEEFLRRYEALLSMDGPRPLLAI